MKKWILLGIGVVGVVVGVAVWRAKGTDTAAAAAPQVEPATVGKGDIFQSVASTGRVVSNLDVDIKCKASGEVRVLPFDVSDTVKQGDLLLEVDPIDQQRALDQARASLATAEARLAQAKQNVTIAEQDLVVARLRADAGLASARAKAEDARVRVKHRRELAEQKLLAAEEVLTFQTAADQAAADVQTAQAAVEALKSQEQGLEVRRQDVKSAQADVDQATASLELAEQRLRDTKVISPMDAVVAARNVQIGVIIASGVTNVGGGTTVLTLSDLSHIFVLATVDESDIGRVALEQPVRITADAFPGTRLRGKVVRIATKGVNVSNVVTFEVKIEVTSENKRMLKPEMTANVEIVAAEKRDVLTVPAQAVTRKQGGKTFATVQKDGGATEERPIEVGLSDGDRYEVLGGLAEGDTVMVRKDEAASRWRPDGARQGSSNPMMGMGGGRGRR